MSTPASDMSWDSVGRSIERDVTRAVAAVAAALVVLGGVVALAADWAWRRHRAR